MTGSSESGARQGSGCFGCWRATPSSTRYDQHKGASRGTQDLNPLENRSTETELVLRDSGHRVQLPSAQQSKATPLVRASTSQEPEGSDSHGHKHSHGEAAGNPRDSWSDEQCLQAWRDPGNSQGVILRRHIRNLLGTPATFMYHEYKKSLRMNRKRAAALVKIGEPHDFPAFAEAMLHASKDKQLCDDINDASYGFVKIYMLEPNFWVHSLDVLDLVGEESDTMHPAVGAMVTTPGISSSSGAASGSNTVSGGSPPCNIQGLSSTKASGSTSSHGSDQRPLFSESAQRVMKQVEDHLDNKGEKRIPGRAYLRALGRYTQAHSAPLEKIDKKRQAERAAMQARVQQSRSQSGGGDGEQLDPATVWEAAMRKTVGGLSF